MVSQEILEIILKAEDQASDTAKKVETQLDNIGNAAQRSNNKAITVADKYYSKLNQIKSNIEPLIDTVNNVGNQGAEAFNRLSSSQQDSIVKFNMLDSETQATLQAIRELGVESTDMIPGANDALSKLADMDNRVRTMGGAWEYAKTKTQLMGASTDTVKGKIQTVGTAIQTYVANKWDNVKTKVSSLASYIQSHLSNALSKVRSGVDRLGSAFGGLGGIIASAIGGLGMASITDMTVGLAMNRERMTSLTNATMGSVEAGKQMIDGYTGVNKVFKDLDGTMTNTFMGLDEMTNHSLVSLDDIGQAMSTIKMSTGMTNEQLMAFSSTVNDIGQRAILMGKSGDEAIGLMQAAGRGLNGEFDMLKTNFGITADQLKELGWSGAADDVKGYQEALDKALEKGGDMDGMLDTTTGHLETLKKNFRVAGRHVGEQFTPYIDMAVQYLNQLDDTCPGLFENLVMIAGGVSMFATVAPALSPMLQVFDMLGGATKSLLMFTGLLEAEEGALTASGLAASASQTMLSIAEMAGADAAVLEAAANGGLTASFWAMATAILANPLTWVAIALIAVAVAVYEVGKSFGWWTDVGSMLQAIWSGINRLWNAFINHPDVQGLIKSITDAWNWLLPKIQEVGQAVLAFFKIQTSGDWDIVSTIIHGIGDAWNALKPFVWAAAVYTVKSFQLIASIVGVAISVGQAVYNALKPIVCILLGCSPGIVPALQTVQSVFGAVFGAIAGFIGGVVSTIVTALQPVLDIIKMIAEFMVSQFLESWNTFVTIVTVVTNGINLLIGIFNMFMTGQITLSGALSLIWTVIANMFRNILILIINRVRSFATNVIALALRTGRGFVTNIIIFLITLPGRVLTILMNVARHVLTAGQQWIVNAHMKAIGMVTGVINGLINLPSHMYNKLSSAVSEITKAGQEWIGEAKAKAGEIVTGVKDKLSGFAGAISGAMSGVKDAIVQPFQDAWNRVSQLASQIRNTSTRPGAGQGGYDLDVSKQINIADPGAYFGRSAVYEGRTDNLDVNINLSGVPSNMNERQLVNLLTSKGVIDALVNNNNFQSANRKATTRYNARLNRSG